MASVLTLAGKLALIFYRNPDAFIVPMDCPFPDEQPHEFSAYVNSHPEFNWNEIIERDREMSAQKDARGYED